MRSHGYLASYILLLAAQIALNNFLNFQQYVILSILPVMVMFLPATCGPVLSLFIAFLTGFAVDFFSGGVLGLTVVALLPVALLRQFIVIIVMGRETFMRGEEMTVARQGVGKVSLMIALALGLYLAVYIPIDSAGTRSIGFIVFKWVVSLAAGTLVSIIVAGLYSDRRKWR